MPALPSLMLCAVVGIADGDTMTVRCEAQADIHPQTLRVRLAQVNAPERRQPYGERSCQNLAALCFQEQAQVRAQGQDRYGRVVANVSCRGLDAGGEQVRAGLAWPYTRYRPTAQLMQLEGQARVDRRGLWADAAPVPPWQWRSESRH